MTSPPEAWLRGPLAGIDPFLMPAAHGLTQASEELAAASDLTREELWSRPGGAAAAGFHLRHIAGSIDRLLAYARGAALSEGQMAVLAAEREPGTPPATADALVRDARAAIAAAIDAIRATPHAALLEPRTVGRARLPSTMLGLLSHIAEHTERHAGQLITTAKVVRGLRTHHG